MLSSMRSSGGLGDSHRIAGRGIAHLRTRHVETPMLMNNVALLP